jgi:type VI protein secretion system component Hcp
MRVSRSRIAAALAAACALGLAGGLVLTGGASHQASPRVVTRSATTRAGSATAAGDAALTALLQSQAASVSGLFMHIPGINGESTDKAHPNWIVISGYRVSFSKQSACGDCAPQFGPLTVTLPYSLAVPPLLKALLTGRLLGTVEIQAQGPVRGAELSYLTITLANAGVTSLNESSSGGRPGETLTLTATSFSVSYTTGTGSPETFCFDFETDSTC